MGSKLLDLVAVVVIVICGLCIAAGGAAATVITQVPGTGANVTTPLPTTTNNGTTVITLPENFNTTITTFNLTGVVFPVKWTTGSTDLAVSTAGAVTVLTGKTLDYETNPTVTAVLTAADSNTTTPLSATVTLTLNVTDVNDNTPIFSPTTYTARIADGTPAGKKVADVNATDADTTAANNVITYSISAGNNASIWSIAGNTGVITVTGHALNKTAVSFYRLVVLATDSGNPKLTGTTTVSITVASKCTQKNPCDATKHETCPTVGVVKLCQCDTGYVDQGTCLADCGAPTKPANGAISVTATTQGSIGTMSCDAGYTLTGAAKIVCQSDKTWNTTTVTCSGAVFNMGGIIVVSVCGVLALMFGF